jgi:hypothetical protein
MATKAVRDLVQQKKKEAFEVWFIAMQLRAAMQNIKLPDLTADEKNAFERSTSWGTIDLKNQ